MRNRYKWSRYAFKMLTCVWHLQVSIMAESWRINLFSQILSMISWSTSQNQCEWFIHESDLNSVLEFNSLNPWSALNPWSMLTSSVTFYISLNSPHNSEHEPIFMVYQKATIPNYCKYTKKSNDFIIQMYYFCAPQKRPVFKCNKVSE